MDRSSERLLAEAIDEVRSGRTSINEILARPEAKDAEFANLLRLAVSIQPVTDLEPSLYTRQALRSRLTSEIARKAQVTNTKCFSSPWGLWNRAFPINHFTVSALALTIMFFITAGGTVYASQGSLPGDRLYGVKLAAEQFQISVALSSEERIEALLQAADRRAAEMEAIGGRASTDVEPLANSYENSVNQAIHTLTSVAENDGNKARVVQRLRAALEKNQLRLQHIYENTSEPARDALLRAKEASQQGLDVANGAVTHGETLNKFEPKGKDRLQEVASPTVMAGSKLAGESPNSNLAKTPTIATIPAKFPSMTPRAPLTAATPTVESKPTIAVPTATSATQVTSSPTVAPIQTPGSDVGKDKKIKSESDDNRKNITPKPNPAKDSPEPQPQATQGPAPKDKEREPKTVPNSEEKRDSQPTRVQQPTMVKAPLAVTPTGTPQPSGTIPSKASPKSDDGPPGKAGGPKQ